jgi:hypothetical protein
VLWWASVKGVAFAVAVLVFAGASGCGRSQRTLEQTGNGGGIGSSGSTGVEVGGMGAAGAGGSGGVAGSGGAAGTGNASMSGAAGSSSEGGKAGAGGVGQVGGADGAGSGGFAGGAVPLTDAEVCADACAQTEFRLPSALCEDWRYPDDEHVAEYCLAGASPDCAVRCEEQLGAVTSDCNVALHRAIPCVARTEFYRQPAAIIDCPFAECTELLVRVTAECNGLRQELAAARQRWEDAGSDSYSFEWSRGATVYDIVVSDGVASLVAGTSTDVPTIPELFDRIEGAIDFAPPSVRYDPVLGYPIEAQTRSPNCQPPDRGFSFTVTGVVLD